MKTAKFFELKANCFACHHPLTLVVADDPLSEGIAGSQRVTVLHDGCDRPVVYLKDHAQIDESAG